MAIKVIIDPSYSNTIRPSMPPVLSIADSVGKMVGYRCWLAVVLLVLQICSLHRCAL